MTVDGISTLRTVDLDLPGRTSGKVREAWPLPNGQRLLVTSDRLSAFDRIIGVVPHKGQVLNQLAAWWFEQTADIVPNHLISTPDPNATICRDVEPLPVEIVVRARLTGSTDTAVLPRYVAGEREMYGHIFPEGLVPHGPLPVHIITPTTKADAGGHDTPTTEEAILADGLVSPEVWREVSEAALALFARGCEVAAAAGFVLADTKYEFGLDGDGNVLLIDEMHTPDSSRYWNADEVDEAVAAGRSPEGFDKEPVRIALRAKGYSGDGEPPELPDEVWTATSNRYIELFERLTGTTFVPGDQQAMQRITANLGDILS